MAQDGDFRFQGNVWSGYDNGTWQILPDQVQEYLTQNYTNVSGTGPSQVLFQRGTDSTVPTSQVSAGVRSVMVGVAASTPTTAASPSSAGPQGQRIRDAYRTWVNNPKEPWPPMKEDITSPKFVNNQFAGYNTIQDTEAIKQFLAYAKQNNLKFTDAPLTGADGTPQAVTIGGQQYFQQPGEDGQFERIPTEKGGASAPKIETIGGIQFINQGGELVPVDNMMKNMKENFVVTGDFQGAAAVHAWETRPSNQEYFDRMLQYVNAPADQLLISAIARGQGLVAPPPEETIQRIGPQPEYLTEAFNMLRDQMQMGQPDEGQTAQDVMLDRAAKLQLQSQEIANKTAEANLQSQMVKDADAHEASLMNLDERATALDITAMEAASRWTPSEETGFAGALAGDQGDAAIGDVEPAGISAFDSQEAAGKSGTDLAERGGRGISMNDGSTAQTIQDFFDGLSDKQKEFVNGWEGGIWTFASSAQNMVELERNLNFHFNNAPETVGKVIPQVDGSSTEITEKGLERIEELGNEGESELAAKVIELAPELISEAPMEPGEIGEDEIQRAGTTGAGMSRDEIFEKYPFLAPKGWREPDIPTETRPAGPMSEKEMDVYGSTLGPTEAEMDVYGSTIPEPYQRDQTRQEVMKARDIEALKDPAGIVSGINKARDFIGSIPGIQDIPFENISGDVRREKADEAMRNMGMDIPISRDAAPLITSVPTPTPVSTVGTHGAGPGGGARTEPHPTKIIYNAYDQGSLAQIAEDSDLDIGMASGGQIQDRMAMVGESGPELALFPNGTEIIPLDRDVNPDQKRRLRHRGVRGMQEGGIVFDNPMDNPLPLGIRQLQAGRSLGAPRGQLLRTAGIALPSAQARRRMLPGEREAFQGLGRMAGIPEGEFQQELGITDPSGARRTGSARMLPLSLRR